MHELYVHNNASLATMRFAKTEQGKKNSFQDVLMKFASIRCGKAV